jgi:hypothetical protein
MQVCNSMQVSNSMIEGALVPKWLSVGLVAVMAITQSLPSGSPILRRGDFFAGPGGYH